MRYLGQDNKELKRLRHLCGAWQESVSSYPNRDKVCFQTESVAQPESDILQTTLLCQVITPARSAVRASPIAWATSAPLWLYEYKHCLYAALVWVVNTKYKPFYGNLGTWKLMEAPMLSFVSLENFRSCNKHKISEAHEGSDWPSLTPWSLQDPKKTDWDSLMVRNPRSQNWVLCFLGQFLEVSFDDISKNHHLHHPRVYTDLLSNTSPIRGQRNFACL